MAWMWLVAAGFCEIAWAAGLKRFGFTFLSVGGIVTLILMLMSFVLLSQAMKTLPLGTSYAVWTGIGAAGTALIGMTFMNEPADWKRLACIALIITGVIGLKLVAKS